MTAAALRLLATFTGPYRWAFPLLVMLGVLASAAEGLGIGLLIPVLNALLDTGTTETAGPFANAMESIASQGDRGQRLLFLALLMTGLVALKTIVLVANVRLAAVINGRVIRDLRVGLCRQLLSIDYSFFSRADSGRLLNLLDVQTHRTSEALMHAVSMLTSACFLLVFGVLLILISWELTLLVVAVALPVSMFVRARTRRAQELGDQLLTNNASLTGRMMELLGAMRTVRMFGQEAAEEERFDRAANEARKTFVRAETITWTVVPVVEMLYLPLFLAALGYAWYTNISVPSLLAFLVLLYRMQPQLSRIDYARVNLSSYAPGMQELADLLRQEDKHYLESGPAVLGDIREGIEFDGVWFTYEGAEKPALEDVSFTIPRGSVCAIVGRSGAGKSTVLNLLFRLYDPDQGIIKIDDLPLPDYELASVLREMAFAGQDADLLAGSIWENIAYGAPAASKDDIMQAARDAHAEEFVLRFPDQYEAQVGERGLRLSGGQRQRIALARALVRHPQILVLDEAINAVDTLTETAIQETIEELAGSCTIIIVAHRLNTVRRADMVLVMSDGRIIEQGAPDLVVGAGGEFSRMYELS